MHQTVTSTLFPSLAVKRANGFTHPTSENTAGMETKMPAVITMLTYLVKMMPRHVALLARDEFQGE